MWKSVSIFEDYTLWVNTPTDPEDKPVYLVSKEEPGALFGGYYRPSQALAAKGL